MTEIRRDNHFRAELETVTIQIQRRFEYDANFMRDRFIYSARCGDQLGYSIVGLGYGALEEHFDETHEIIEGLLPEMRRTALDSALELGYGDEIKRLARTIHEQQAEIEFLSRPLRRKVADRLLDFWCRLKAVYS